MQVGIFHPLKHHLINSIKGIELSDNQVETWVGFQQKRNLLGKIIDSTSHKDKLQGYNYEHLNVKSQFDIECAFLLFQSGKISLKNYLNYFNNRNIGKVRNKDIVHVLQDYCSSLIKEASRTQKKIVYELIQPFSLNERNLVLSRLEENGIDEKLINKLYPLEKIELNKENLNAADFIHVASKQSYSAAIKQIGEGKKDKIIYFPYGTNTFLNSDFNELSLNKRLDEKKGQKIDVLYVGNLSILKGTDILLKIIENSDKDKFNYHVVGVPRTQEDNYFVEKINQNSNVRYYSHIPHGQMYKIYKRCDVFIFPSIIEGFGMVTSEAMSFGLPCIVNKNSVGLVNEKTGIIVEKNEFETYIQALERLWNSKELLYQKSINSYRHSRKHSWSAFQENWCEFYKKISSGE